MTDINIHESALRANFTGDQRLISQALHKERMIGNREALKLLKGDLALVQDDLRRNPRGDNPFLVPSGYISREEVYQVIERRLSLVDAIE